MRITFASVIVLIATTGSVHAAPPAGNTWTLDPSRSDEFNGAALDTTKWFSGPLWYGSTGGGWPFKPENGFVQDGNLNLRAVPGPPMSVASVHSKFLIPGNSYLEVRAKCLPWAARVLTAIWLQGPYQAQYDPNIEVDIQEVFNPRRITSNLHLWSAGSNRHVGDGVGHPVDVGVDVTADFHLYGLERRGTNVIKIYFDDKLVWDAKPSNPPQYATQERWLILDLEGHLGAPNTANLPAAALIDYARLYVLGGPGTPDGGPVGAGGAPGSGGAPGRDAAPGGSDLRATGDVALGGTSGGTVASGGGGSPGGTAGEGGQAGAGGTESTRSLANTGGTATAAGTGGAAGKNSSGAPSTATESETANAGCSCSMSRQRAWPLSTLLLFGLLAIRRRTRT